MESNDATPAGGWFLALRSALWALIGPGTVTILLPWCVLTRWWPAGMSVVGAVRLAGVTLILCGAAVLAHCVWVFASHGRGTLSAVDAPKRLVVRGLYRYTRNPMYLGVFCILVGEAVLFWSSAMLVYASAWAALVALAVPYFEEPGLHASFGPAYTRYCASVRRWLPGPPFSDPLDA